MNLRFCEAPGLDADAGVRRHCRARVTLAAALVLFAALSAPCAAAPRSATYVSQGRTIHVDVHRARGPQRHAVIVVLHGSGGILGNVGWMNGYADALTRSGYAVYIPHYYDRTGHIAVGDIGEMRRNFKAWLAAARDGVTFALRDSGERRAGLVGLSLGGFLSTALSAQDKRVRAVVEMCGGLPPSLPVDATRLPPMLVLHGGRDPVVPVTAAYNLVSVMQLAGRPCEVKIYDEQGHGFVPPAAEDAQRRTVAFLSRWLR